MTYFLFPFFLLLTLLSFILFLLNRNKLRFHLIIIDQESAQPRPGVKVYGLSLTADTSLGQTSSGEFVRMPNGNTLEHLKKIGVTNEQGEFQAEYWINNYAMIVFDLLNEYNLPNQFLSSDLRLQGKKSKKKIIEVLPSGRMKIKNPTLKQKTLIKNKFN